MTSLQPSFGKIYANFDIKIVYLIALLIFESARHSLAMQKNLNLLLHTSWLCDLRRGSELGHADRRSCACWHWCIRIVFRRCAIQPLSFTRLTLETGMNIVTYTVPLESRAIYIAALSSMFGVASVVGPLLGGVFTDKVSWRWCFWINLPFGGFTAIVLFLFLKSPPRKHTQKLTLREKIAQIDILGALFLIGGIVCLLLALQWGGTTYAWKNSKIWGLFLGFGLTIAVFIGIQFKRQNLATIPPGIFKQRTVLVSALFTSLFSMALYMYVLVRFSANPLMFTMHQSHILSSVLLPRYDLCVVQSIDLSTFLAIKGTTAVQSGIRTIPYLVSITVSSIIIGGIITVTGIYHYYFWAGAVIFVVGCGMLQTLDVPASAGKWIGYQLLAGFGAGAAVQIPFLAVQVALPAADIPVGSEFASSFC